MNLLQLDFDPEIAAKFGDVGDQSIDLLGVPLFDGPSLWTFLIRFGFNLLVCWVITHFLYYKKSQRRDYYFTYMLFSSVIFLILYQLQNLQMEMTLALGLFAIFSMIRYRTEQMPIREMTYLFVLIGLSIINGSGLTSSYTAFVVTNLLVVLLIWLLESLGFTHRQATKIITYEKIDLIRPDRREELLSDLRQRTGLDIIKVQVGSINFLKDTAFLKVTYVPDDPEPNDIDMVTKFKNK
ncbi:MAG: DUF4956 domain-containing protein [Bacteroidales bacterium]|nr:DUF4956 domain-containing protein [Bacteroidales bacterium]